MKIFHSIFLALLVIFCCCGNPQIDLEKRNQAILDSFKRIDSSLLVSAALLDNTNKEIAGSIGRNNKARITDTSLNNKRAVVINLISLLKQKLQQEMERTGNDEDTSFVNTLFLNQRKGLKLHEAITAYGRLLSGFNNPIADSIFSSSASIPTGVDWANVYFENTPIIAAITMLKKIELDIQRSYLTVIKLK